MKKEQTLVLVAIAAAALVVYSNTGLYAAVGVGDLENRSSETHASSNVKFDPQAGLPVDFGEGRNLLRQNRTETRPPLPVIARPTPLPPTWVRLLPWPYPDAANWSALRERIAGVPAPADDVESTTDTGDDVVDEMDDPLAEKPIDPATKSVFVYADGTTEYTDIVPAGRHKGKPLWDVLADWPNVEATVTQLNQTSLKAIGTYRLDNEMITNRGITTFHLPKTCENEYHEERLRRRVAPTDRGSLMDLSRWVMDTLEPRYGIEAVGFAVRTMEEARKLKIDLALARELAELYRKAYDLEGELRTLQDFVQDGNQTNPAALELLGDALARGGALASAATRYQAGAVVGSAGARLGLANVKLRMGDLAGALDAFRAVQSAGSVEEQASAHAGEARVLIRQGQFAEALTAARRGVQIMQSHAEAQTVLGAALYYLGRYPEAEAAFRAGVALSPQTHTRARSNLGMALVAEGRLDDAIAEFKTCLDTDALNFFDPMAGLGDALQRQGRLTAANDRFETARTRDPSNPWILLRLGTAKLRDGVSDRALTLGRALVSAAPGCVDGLRLAGLAASAEAVATSQALADPSLSAEDRATLETALDAYSTEALRHLERAMSKEPENVAVLRQYVLALLQAGRAQDALDALETATATGVGFARRDGRALLLRAYSLFILHGEIDRVRELIDQALKTDIDDAAKDYAREMKRVINDWDALRIWKDEFRRAGPKLFLGWTEDDERHGIQVNAQGEYAQFVTSTAVRSSADGRDCTRFTRTEDAKKIREWEASFRVPSLDTQFVMHIYEGALQNLTEDDSGGRRTGKGGGELAFAVTRDGKMQIWSTGGGTRGRAGALIAYPITAADGNERMWPRDGAFHTVRMERTDHDEGEWQLFFDGEPIGEPQKVAQLKAMKGRSVTLGFQVDADRGTRIEVHVDRVQITRTVD